MTWRYENLLKYAMHYCYILLSSKSHKFYFGSANNLKERIKLHNFGRVKSTKPYMPWKLIWYGAFFTEKEARDFEFYLKSGPGKSFAYKRLVPVALEKDFSKGRKSSPKQKKVRIRNNSKLCEGYRPLALASIST